MGLGKFFDDFVEFIGPDTPLLDTDEERKKKDLKRGRPNQVHEIAQDAVHLVGPDTPLFGGPTLEEDRKKRNESDDMETKRTKVTVQIINPYDGNIYKLVKISIGTRADYAAFTVATELGLREQSEYELIYFDKGIPVAVDPNELVLDYWHMSKMVLQVKPVRKYV